MAFVVSAGQVASLQRGNVTPALPYGASYRTDYQATYEEIYRTQPAVRSVVGFMARNIAQIGLHVYNRLADDNRERVNDHPLARLLWTPMPPKYKVTKYRLIHDMVMDVGIYDMALWLKVKTDEEPSPGGLLRIPPRMFKPVGDNWFAPSGFEIRGNKGKREVDAEEVVFIRGYNPDSEYTGMSPMETLRTTLKEEWESTNYRAQMWENGARISGVIQRPTDAPRWRDGARKRFLTEWEETYSGRAAGGGGGTPLLEDGMSFVNSGITPEQAQYMEGRKFTRLEVANAYWIPPPMVGLLEHATFSNIKEQHQMLYQDALGPWLEQFQQEIELQLLPDFEDRLTTTVYVEFNISDKLKGSFEEQASSLSTLVGRPVLTANEGRALLNRNALEDGEGLVTPLNVLVGGQAAPTAPTADPGTPVPAPDLAATGTASRREISAKARVSEDATADLEDELAKFFERQGNSIASKVGAKAKAGLKASAEEFFDDARWDSELSGVLFPIVSSMAATAGASALEEVGLSDEYDEERTEEWLLAHVGGVASGINGATKFLLDAALKREGTSVLDAVKHVFEVAKTSRAKAAAQSESTAAASFGTHEAIRQTGKEATKTWVTTSPRPRKSHKRLNGQTVGMDELFSNGARWPGDSKLRGEERAHCSCDLRISVEDQ